MSPDGQAVDLLGLLWAPNPRVEIAGNVGWRPLGRYAPDPAADVASHVRAGAGVGRPWAGGDASSPALPP